MRLPLLICGVAFAASAACAERTRSQPPNIVIVTLDTTRADRLQPYGFENAIMPALTRLAREGVVFEQAISPAPLTLPAHSSLFTGLQPFTHGVRDNAWAPLAPRAQTLAEIARARGYRTAAFVASAVLNADRGLAQGFDRYGDVAINRDVPLSEEVVSHGDQRSARQRRASDVVSDALAWLAEPSPRPFLLWTHLYDPHRPYAPPEPFATQYANNPYVGEIAYADSQIARLLDELTHRDLLERTIIVVTADHGESLWEHGERDHGIFVYESATRVPLIVRAPGVAPRRSTTLVRLIDVMPTVLDLAGLDPPQMDGISLRGVLNGEVVQLEAYAESEYPRRYGWSSVRALRDSRFKFIDAPRPELYDLERDPFEQINIIDTRRSTAAAMLKRLQTITAAGRDPTSGPVPRELQARLAALGYASGVPAFATSDASLRDPKDCIAEYSARAEGVPVIQDGTAAASCFNSGPLEDSRANPARPTARTPPSAAASAPARAPAAR